MNARVLPAKRQDGNCTRRYSKGLRNQKEEHLCKSSNLMKYKSSLLYSISFVESINNIKIKMTCHRVIGDGCIWKGTSLMNA